MPHAPKISSEKANALRQEHARGASARSLAKREGVDPRTMRRALAAAKTPGRVRRAEEFKGVSAATAQIRQQPIGDWTLETIRAARDAQMRGDFKQPVRLAEAMRTDDALFVGYHNRLAPIVAIATELKPAGDSTRAIAVAKRAASSVFASRAMLEGVEGTLVNHGIAVMQIKQVVNDDGTRVDFHIEEWPLEHVKWNNTREVLETVTKNGGFRRDIVHGDGEWIVVRKFAAVPWTQEACLLPAAMVWAGHAYSLGDWAQATKTHGQAKMAAQLPQGFALEENVDGALALSPEARSVLTTLQEMVSGDAGAGIFPNGTEVDFLANGSTAWQVFDNFVQNREKASARIYQGTDAAMGSVGGAPGVDISILFGVTTTKIQGDFEAIEQAMNSGCYQVWTAINEGDSRYAPSLHFLMPDPDAAQRAKDEDAAREKFHAEIKRLKENGFVIDQTVVNGLAAKLGISPAPVLASVEAQTNSLVLAPTDVARVVRVREARASQGLPPFGDERDDLTLPELEAAAKAKADAAAAAPTAPAPAPAAPPPAA